MKISRRKLGGSNRDGGAALIIVLACLIFVSMLTVAFLVSMRSKLALSKSGSDSSEVKMLAETAVNIAISQVRDATKKAGQNSLAWASQPGMVRLYDSSGNAAGYYKLYSAESMVATTGAFNPASDAIPAGWEGSPAVFADLNAPANGVFPILDFNAATGLGVQGFSLGTVPGATTAQPAPMPVKWLYVLEDGSLHIPAASSSGTKAVISAATKQNPIVGRIAFWADDETCKVNVNTASEGTFWATPRFNTTGDRQLAISQPARGEYQRYPGHPGTVSLNAVFPTLSSTNVFQIAPRLSLGGSENATKPVQNVTNWVQVDNDRLYASIDEVLLQVPAATETNRSVQGGLSRANVEASRFFLTTSSRAPELNLFGLPRIATWPIHAINDDNYRTVSDRLLAFCATLGGPPPAATYPFYFTRQENVLPEHDISLARNKTLLDYLDRLTAKPIPGFGGNFQAATKYGQAETRQILTEIFDYIRSTNLVDKTTTQNPAGFWPYTFGLTTQGQLAKGSQDYGEGRSLGTAVPAYRTDWGTRGFGGRFLQVRAAHLHFVGLGQGTVGSTAATPINTLQQGIRVGMDLSADSTGNTPPADTVAVQAYFYVSTLTPGEGCELWSPGHWIEIEGLDKLGIKLQPSDTAFTPLQFPVSAEATIMGNMLGGGGVVGARLCGLEPFSFTYAKNELKQLTNTGPTEIKRRFPFFSAIFPVKNTAPTSTMAFEGGTIKIRVYAEKPYQAGVAHATHGALIQELILEFPNAVFPTPKLANNRLVGSGDGNNTLERWREGWRPPGMQYFEDTNDVLKTLPLVDGDIRMLVGPSPTGPPYFFGKPPVVLPAVESVYDDITKRVNPAATGSQGSLSRSGKLVKNAGYVGNAPWVPDHINGVSTTTGAPGDWDNGTALVGDGPFVNAADPGSVSPNFSLAYFDNSNTTASAKSTFFSPNRQMPGPGMFGSLSTGVQRRRPWQTLLFRPGPPNHPGADSPPDHLLLDLFWMPVVEPYAISEPFSTAGKINMNQQLVPFTYINRTAGLRAALASEQIAMVSKSEAGTYKAGNDVVAGLTNARLPLNLSETNGTLRQFKEKFANGEIFRSATEISDIYLVPQGKSWSSNGAAQADWYGDDFAMVGDNTRERPYAHLYNKLTTKSNTFTAHYHAQVLQKPKARIGADPTIFDTSQGDKVVAEQRGATTFERYLDPSDSRIVATDPASSTATALEEFYRARIVNTTIFSP